MASKPTDVPRWATDETNNDEPSDPQKDTGWTTNQVIVSTYFNWLFELIYEWIIYLRDGALEGDHSIDGPGGAAATLTVHDRIILVPDDPTFSPAGTGIVDANEYYFEVARTRNSSALGARPRLDGSTWHFEGLHWDTPSATIQIDYPLDVESREHIRGFTVYIDKESSNATTIQATLVSYDRITNVETILETATIATNVPGFTSFGKASGTIDHAVLSGKSYFVSVVRSVGASTADLIGDVEVIVTKPL